MEIETLAHDRKAMKVKEKVEVLIAARNWAVTLSVPPNCTESRSYMILVCTLVLQHTFGSTKLQKRPFKLDFGVPPCALTHQRHTKLQEDTTKVEFGGVFQVC